jgi:hypothetical protein
MEKMDLTNYLEIQQPAKLKTILTCHVRLDKKSMLEALSSEAVFINGKYYKVPEEELLDCLINKRFGQTKLNLEQIV